MDTLVLSSAYEPMSQVSWQRAIGMWFAGRVEILEQYEDRIIRTVSSAIRMPAVVRFVGAVLRKYPNGRPVRFSRNNVFLRDKGRCQYCNIILDRRTFTLDHIVPACRGGKKVWENIVACCGPCNQKKGNSSLKHSKMRPRRKPYIPKYLPTGVSGNKLPSTWQRWVNNKAFYKEGNYL